MAFLQTPFKRDSHFEKKKLDIPQRSMYTYISELKDSKHYYTSKAFSFSINERAVPSSMSRLFHFLPFHRFFFLKREINFNISLKFSPFFTD
jgi:hypothetical protein